MATIQSVIDLARATLVDITPTRWLAPEMLSFYNIAKDQLVVMRPDIASVMVEFETVEGSRQVAPTRSLGIVDVRRNLGADGETPGKVIKLADIYDLDSARSNWMTMASADVPGADDGVLNWAINKRDPKVFYLWPVPDAGWHVELVHSLPPADSTNAGDALPFDDVYRTPLHYLIVATALMQDTTSGDDSKAQTFLQRAEAFMGVSRATKAQNEPQPPAVAQQLEAR